MSRHFRAAVALAAIVVLLAAGVSALAVLAPAAGMMAGPLGFTAGGLIVAALYLSWDVVDQLRNRRH